jgi:hypothetical protein
MVIHGGVQHSPHFGRIREKRMAWVRLTPAQALASCSWWRAFGIPSPDICLGRLLKYA